MNGNTQTLNTDLHTLEEAVQSKKAIFTFNEFSGPLDLLLFLVKQQKIDVYDIPISEITEQYLTYLKEIITYELDDLSGFYRVAAWLLFIKSKTLLPVHSDLDEEEINTSRTELINVLIEYQKYKKLSDKLSERYEEFNWTSLRQEGSTLPLDLPKENVWKEVNALELFSIFMKLMDKSEEYQRVIDLNEPVTVNEKITLIYEILDKKESCSFDDIVADGGVVAVVCALLALLELMKQQEIKAKQHQINGDIQIFRGSE